MRRLCPIPFIPCYCPWSPVVWRHVTLSSHHPSGDVDGLLREIKRLGTRRGRGEHKLRVPASMLRPTQTSDGVVRKHGTSHLSSTSRKDGVCKAQTPVVIAEPTAYTDVACTLQELEGALFQLARDESLEAENQQTSMECKSTVGEKSDNDTDTKLSGASWKPHDAAGEHLSEEVSHDENIMKADECHDALSCWTNTDSTLDASQTLTVLHVTSLHHSTFTLELREQPRSIHAIITLISQTLSEVESLAGSNSEKTLLFRTIPNIPFFTPLQSELELTPLARRELMMSKERLFQRMQDASTRGISFIAELQGSALDFGAELFLFCNGSLSPNLDTSSVRIGFTSISLGVWPPPCVVKRIDFAMGSLEKSSVAIPILHTLTWEKLSKTYPKLLLGLQPTDRGIWRIWDKVYLFTLKQIKNMCVFLGLSLKHHPIANKGGDFIQDQWEKYCDFVNSISSTTNTIPFSKVNECLELYTTLLGTPEFVNTAAVAKSLCRMHRRVLEPPPLPVEAFVEARPTDLNNVKERNSFLVFPEGSSPATVRFIAEQRACREGEVIQCAMLFGDAENMNEVMEMLDCAVIVTPLGVPKLQSTCEGAMMEVYLRSTPTVGTEKRKEILSSAVAYLQSRKIPYIVSRGGVGKRLVAALSMELCQLSLEVDMSLIESTARQFLGFRISPFQLVDYYGTSRLLRVLHQYTHMVEERQTVSAAVQLFSQMSAGGYGGEGSCRGGFYNRTGHLNRDVVVMFMGRKHMTRHDVVVRLLAALINESCRIILDGCVETVQDINLISLAALALHPSTGGLLSCVDGRIGFTTLLKCMTDMSHEVGVISPPSPLLLAMLEKGETFRTLSKETLLQVRRKK